MDYHYLDSQNQPAGPASLATIRTLSREGKIAADPMVCPVGGSEWKLLSAVEHPATPGGAAGSARMPVSGTLLGDFVARLVKIVAAVLNPGLVEKSLGLARHFGQYAVLAGGALGLIAAIVLAIRVNSFAIFLGGVVFVVALAVAQFAASRFLGASDTLIATTPSRLSSLAFLECLGLFAALGALGVLIGGLVSAIQLSSAAPLVPAILLAIFWTFFSAIALHPHLAAVEAGTGSAGEEAIGLLAFCLKAVLKLVPLLFALLAIAGALALLVGLVAPNSSFAGFLGRSLPTLPLPGLAESGIGGAGVVLTAALLPMVAYFAYLVASLPLELWRAVLSLPGKLDALRR